MTKERGFGPFFISLKIPFFVTVTKKELHSALVQARLLNPPYKKEHPLMQEAMKLYISETGDHRASFSCGSCINKMKKWLER